MRTRKTRGLPAELEAVRRRFEHWRRTHEQRSRIPGSLWGAAAKMAGRYGLCRTARALRIGYYSLKRRVEQSSGEVSGRPAPGPATAFVEWPTAMPARTCECTVELEDAVGSKMRIRVTSAALPDLASISRSFWNPLS
jgi:hypothetical protein